MCVLNLTMVSGVFSAMINWIKIDPGFWFKWCSDSEVKIFLSQEIKYEIGLFEIMMSNKIQPRSWEHLDGASCVSLGGTHPRASHHIFHPLCPDPHTWWQFAPSLARPWHHAAGKTFWRSFVRTVCFVATAHNTASIHPKGLAAVHCLRNRYIDRSINIIWLYESKSAYII